MKLCGVVAIAVLVVVLCSQAQSQSVLPEKCCFEYYTKPLPARNIKSYKYTRTDCPKKGVIFITLKDKELCVNPEDSTIQVIMEKLDGLWEAPTASR